MLWVDEQDRTSQPVGLRLNDVHHRLQRLRERRTLRGDIGAVRFGRGVGLIFEQAERYSVPAISHHPPLEKRPLVLLGSMPRSQGAVSGVQLLLHGFPVVGMNPI